MGQGPSAVLEKGIDCLAPRIGVFDSGIGGLTVLKALAELIPSAEYLYLGDTARLPYGTKSPEIIAAYSVKAVKELVSRGIDCLVIACNTVSCCAVSVLQDAFPALPIVDVILPTVSSAVARPQAQPFLVLATEATVSSQIYRRLIQEKSPQSLVYQLPTSLFVSVAEEGWDDSELVHHILRRYIRMTYHVNTLDVKTVILGCTHFPFLLTSIQSYFGPDVQVIGSAGPTADRVLDFFSQGSRYQNLNNRKEDEELRILYLVTDAPERFARVGAYFMGQPIQKKNIELISF